MHEKRIKNELDAESDLSLAPYNESDPDLALAEVLIIGPQETQPIRLVQKLYASDPLLAVLLLAEPTEYATVKQSIQFAAQIGINTICIAYTPTVKLASIILNAALRTRQKRSFRRLKLSTRNLVVGQPFAAVQAVHLGSFLDQAPVGVVLIDPVSGKIEAMNEKTRRILKFGDDNVNSVTLQKLFKDYPFEAIEDLLQNRTSQPTELESLSQTIEVTATETANEGQSQHIMLFISDVSSKKDEQRKIRVILESLPQMAFTLDSEGKADFFTQTWYTYTGQSELTAQGSGWLDCIHPDDLGRLKDKLEQAYRSGKNFQYTARVCSAAGPYRWHLVRAVAVYKQQGEVQLWTGSLTDIHDQVSLTEALEQKVSERTQQLLASNIELEQYARVASHDLQEPLRKISIFTNMVKDQSAGKLDDSAVKYLDKVLATAARMTQTLRDLLSFAHLGKKEEFREVDLNDVIAQVIEDLELVIAQKNASINTSRLPVLLAAPSQMRQLFYNLLNNALKFSKADHAPLISIRAKALPANRIFNYPELDPYKSYHEIEIKDNGIGFEQKYAQQIFSIFQRLHTTSSYEGTGIGLAICKKVVLNHGGAIFVLSEPGIGSRFGIILSASPKSDR